MTQHASFPTALILVSFLVTVGCSDANEPRAPEADAATDSAPSESEPIADTEPPPAPPVTVRCGTEVCTAPESCCRALMISSYDVSSERCTSSCDTGEVSGFSITKYNIRCDDLADCGDREYCCFDAAYYSAACRPYVCPTQLCATDADCDGTTGDRCIRSTSGPDRGLRRCVFR
jgi:hypothetical protein